MTCQPLGHVKYRTLSDMINLTDPLSPFFFFFIAVHISLHKRDSPVVGVCCACCPLRVCMIHRERKNPPCQQLC